MLLGTRKWKPVGLICEILHIWTCPSHSKITLQSRYFDLKIFIHCSWHTGEKGRERNDKVTTQWSVLQGQHLFHSWAREKQNKEIKYYIDFPALIFIDLHLQTCILFICVWLHSARHQLNIFMDSFRGSYKIITVPYKSSISSTGLRQSARNCTPTFQTQD